MIRIVRGNPTPEELAAALAVVRARASGGAEQAPAPPASEWSSPARVARTPRPVPGPGAWARTYWPS
ncbi:acyl-CoA carboxylase subunit epsilon [Streptomyces sp. NPDC003691]